MFEVGKEYQTRGGSFEVCGLYETGKDAEDADGGDFIATVPITFEVPE